MEQILQGDVKQQHITEIS